MGLYTKSPNIIERDFYAHKPYRMTGCDITEIPCKDGKLHIAIVLLCGGKRYEAHLSGESLDVLNVLPSTI